MRMTLACRTLAIAVRVEDLSRRPSLRCFVIHLPTSIITNIDIFTEH